MLFDDVALSQAVPPLLKELLLVWIAELETRKYVAIARTGDRVFGSWPGCPRATAMGSVAGGPATTQGALLGAAI